MGSLRQMYAISAAKARGHSILMAGWVRFTVKSTAQRIAFLCWMPSEGGSVCAGKREPRGVWLSAFCRSTRTADLYPAEIYGGSHGHKAENTRFF